MHPSSNCCSITLSAHKDFTPAGLKQHGPAGLWTRASKATSAVIRFCWVDNQAHHGNRVAMSNCGFICPLRIGHQASHCRKQCSYPVASLCDLTSTSKVSIQVHAAGLGMCSEFCCMAHPVISMLALHTGTVYTMAALHGVLLSAGQLRVGPKSAILCGTPLSLHSSIR
jgi:hypothetical protein